MSFSNMLKILQEKNRDTIILIKTGIFYIATGKDAVFLNKQFGLKCICFKNQVCKIGIPETRIEYYMRKLEQLDIAYIVYNFNSKKEQLIVEYQNSGRYHNEKNDNKNCLICKGVRMYQDEDKYMKALQKMFEKELKE